MTRVLSSILLLLTLSSCFKTAEEIQREKMVDEQLSQSSKIIAELSAQISELKGGLASTSGQIEEIDYKNKQKSELQVSTFEQSITQLAEQVKILTTENTNTQKEIAKLRSEVKAQKEFIQKVTGTLSQMGGHSTSGKSTLNLAHQAFEKNQQKKAKELYLQVLNDSKVSNSQKNHVYYNLGLLEFWNKQYDDALVYFSKVYTKFPKSNFAPASLLYIGRSFKQQGKDAEAKATFEELVKNYPKSKHSKSAQKELH